MPPRQRLGLNVPLLIFISCRSESADRYAARQLKQFRVGFTTSLGTVHRAVGDMPCPTPLPCHYTDGRPDSVSVLAKPAVRRRGCMLSSCRPLVAAFLAAQRGASG